MQFFKRKLRVLVFIGKHIIIQQLQYGNGLVIIAIGGSSLSIDKDTHYWGWGDFNPSYSKANITKRDPVMVFPSAKPYGHGSVYSVFFRFGNANLEEAGQELAAFINDFHHSRMVIIHAHSKGGSCAALAMQWINRRGKVHVIAVSSCMNTGGIPAVDSPIFCPKLPKWLRPIYLRVFVNHPVDKDLKRDSPFLQELDKFLQNGTLNDNCCITAIAADCEGFLTINPITLFFRWLNRRIGIKRGDGIVPLRSQFPNRKNKQISWCRINATHMNSFKKSLSYVLKLIREDMRML